MYHMYIYIYIYIYILCLSVYIYIYIYPPSREEDPSEDELSEHQIRGWRAVSAAGLGSRERIVFSQTGSSISISREFRGVVFEDVGFENNS